MIGLKTPEGLDVEGVDRFWMQQALLLADLAEAQGEVPVGALIVYEGVCIAAASNAPISLNDPTAHAEVLALRQAGQVVGNYRLLHTTLYVTLEPCAMCAGAMVHARVGRVVYAAADPRTGACGSVFNLVQSPQLNHQCQVQGGVCAEDSRQRLQAFFRQRRHLSRVLAADDGVCQDVASSPLSME